MKMKAGHSRSRRLVIEPSSLLPPACESVKSFNELMRCYNGNGEDKLNIECKIAGKSCYYKVDCKQVDVTRPDGSDEKTYECKGDHVCTSIICCNYKCTL